MNEDSTRQRIGIYGGTFDPPHHGHFQVAEAVWRAFALERLLFVPAFVPPHKRELAISTSHHRYAMLALATAERPRLFVSTVELAAPTRPYTIETLTRLQSAYAAAQLFFVMGADSFRDVTLWREHERLLSEFDIIVAARPGVGGEAHPAAHLSPPLQARVIDLRGGGGPQVEDFAAPRIYLTDYVAADVSATEIRAAVLQGRAIEAFVPAAVAAYVAKYDLYRQL